MNDLGGYNANDIYNPGTTPQRAARMRAQLSLAQVDACTGIGLARLSLLERLPPARLTPRVRRLLADAYCISIDELVGEGGRER